MHSWEKVNFRSQILERPSIGEYWNISGVPVLPENVIFTSFRTCWCYSEAYNTGTQKWSSIGQYSCTSIWDLNYTFSHSCKHELSKLIYIVFRKSLDSGTLLKDWKTARVTPFFLKKGQKTKARNSRPVSLTCIPCKVMETLIKSRILDHVEEHSVLSNKRHGFMKGRLCLTNLLETLKEVTDSLDQGFVMEMIFLDYAEAFDSVPHKRLINKLQAYGCTACKVSRWVQDFLIGRTQTVSVRNLTLSQADV